MRAMRAIAAVVVIAALFACKKKKDETPLPDAAASAPVVEIDAAPPPAETESAVVVDAGLAPHPVTTVKKDAGTDGGHGGAGATDGGGTAGVILNLKCTGDCVQKFGTCIAGAKDQETNRKCRQDMLACRKACPSN